MQIELNRGDNLNDLPIEGFLRIHDIIGRKFDEKRPNKPAIKPLIPICKAAWWAGVKAGKFPKPVKLGSRTTVWRASDIRAFINGDLIP